MIDVKRNRFNSIIVALATITAICLTLHNNGFAEEASQIHVVEIQDLKFIPNEINVNPGDVVQWVNHDFIPHTATANDEKWNSELIGAKASWQMTVEKETFEDYFCVYHPGMKGKIIIAN